MGLEFVENEDRTILIGARPDSRLGRFLVSLNDKEKDIFDAFLVEYLDRLISKMIREGFGKV